jgi:hypothetical protein
MIAPPTPTPPTQSEEDNAGGADGRGWEGGSGCVFAVLLFITSAAVATDATTRAAARAPTSP